MSVDRPTSMAAGAIESAAEQTERVPSEASTRMTEVLLTVREANEATPATVAVAVDVMPAATWAVQFALECPVSEMVSAEVGTRF